MTPQGARKFTAADLVVTAILQGLTAFGEDPLPGQRVKILLASLGLDPRQPAVGHRLWQLFQMGHIELCRVDMMASVPEDRRETLARSELVYDGATYHAIAWDGADLVERQGKDLLDEVYVPFGGDPPRTQVRPPTQGEWMSLTLAAAAQAGLTPEQQRGIARMFQLAKRERHEPMGPPPGVPTLDIKRDERATDAAHDAARESEPTIPTAEVARGMAHRAPTAPGGDSDELDAQVVDELPVVELVGTHFVSNGPGHIEHAPDSGIDLNRANLKERS